MKRQSCVVAILVVLAAGACTAQTSLGVMTFNIRYGSANDGENAWDKRKEVVVNAIREYAPDILGVQECLEFQAQYLDDALPEYEHFGVGRKGDGTGERMEVFYRTDVLAPLETGNFWLSKTPDVPGSRDWQSANIRMVTWARFYHFKSERPVYFLNTHFDHRSVEARKHAALVLERHLRKLPRGVPVIVGGDFNATAESSEPWEILTGRRLSDAWILAEERIGPAITWSGFAAPEDSVKRIDWLLIGGVKSVTQCETVLYNENGRYPSDHYPVFCSFVF